jgi:hypothetical protein
MRPASVNGSKAVGKRFIEVDYNSNDSFDEYLHA